MTLEKLLIFGFAIAVFAAIAVVARNQVPDRGDQYDTYKTKVETLVDKTSP